jgi:hypothetical protein
MGKPSKPMRFFIWVKWASQGAWRPYPHTRRRYGLRLRRFTKVLDVGYLEELAEHQGPEVPLGVVLYGSSGAVFVEVCPEDGLDRC